MATDKYEGDLTGKRVLLAASAMAPEYQDEKWRLVDVTGGFGSSPSSDGKMFVRHVEDGSSAYYRNHMIERVVGDVPADEAEFSYDVAFDEGEGSLGTVMAKGDNEALERAAEAAGGHGGFDFFGRLIYTDAAGTTHVATAVRSPR